MIINFKFAEAQVSSIEQKLSEVKAKVDQINYYANGNNIKQAVTLLNSTQRDFDRYVSFYFEDEFRKTRDENPSYVPSINVQFSNKLTAAYWEDRVKRSQRNIDRTKEALSEGHHRRTLDSQDEVWSYLKTIYDGAMAIKDVVENVGTMEYVDAVKSAKEGIDGFIDNYKKIEEAKLQIINTELYETDVRGLIRRAERMEEANWQFASYMRAYEDDVNDFYRVIDLMNSRVNQLNQETVVDWSSPDYSWNAQSYTMQIKQLQTKFKAENLDYESLEDQIKQIIEKADDHKTEISNNIYQIKNSPDVIDKANQLEKDFYDFNDLAYDIIDECHAYEKNKPANPFEDMQANAGVSQQQGNADSNFGDTPIVPSGKRIKNTFYHNIWGNQSGHKISFKQNGSSVMIGNKSGQIKNGVLTYYNTAPDNVPYKTEYKLVGDGYKMEVRKELTERMISDKLYFASGMHRPPKKEEIEEYRAKNGSVEVSELTYMGSFLAMTNDSDRDFVRDDFDNCLNTPEGLTVSNGGVNIMGCSTGQNPNQQTNTSLTENDNQEESENPFASSTSSSSQQTQSFDQQNNSFNSNVTKPQKPYSEPIGKVGTISNDGNGDGTYCSLAVEKINDSDILGFSVLSGTIKFVQIIYRDKNGFWRTKYEGKRTEFKASEFLKDIPGNITHLNFTVNSNHNRYGRGDEPCEMEVWHLPANGKIPTHSGATQAAQLNNNKLFGEFETLIEKANAAFNKPYWKDSNSGNVTINATNPKQESLNYLRKAEQIINQQSDLTTKYNMVCRLANVSSSFAKRVFANTAKVDFIKLAGNLLSKYSNTISSITKDVNGMSAPKARFMAYKKVAEAWRDLTKAALWGDGQFNKMYCDKQSKRYYELALQEDRKNIELQKTVEKINAPKKPVPVAVKKFKEIEPEVWNEAQTIMTQLEDDIIVEKVEANHLQVADMTLEYLSGTVSIMRSGGAEIWKKVTDSHVLIFPGDKIKTNADAKGVSMTFIDQTFLAIKNNAEIHVLSDCQLIITRGDLSINVTKKGSKFLVISQTCAVGVRGTEFEVNVKDDKTTEVYLYEGVVETRNENDIAYLVPGQKITAKKGEDKFQQTEFNSQRRLETHWRGFEQQKRKHEQIKSSKKISQPKKNVPPVSKKPKTKPPAKSISTANMWSLNTYNNNIESFKQNVTTKTNNGFVPVGLNCTNSQYEVLYLGGGILTITAWNMEWYNDANSLQAGITKNMNQGYIPSGFSWNGSAYYVFYIKTNFTGQAWQVVPSALDLKAVTTAIQPYVEQNYVPMGITLFGDEYYTLLVQFVEPLADKWFIEGYNDKRSEIVKSINKKFPEGSVPWGILKSGGIANILYIGM